MPKNTTHSSSDSKSDDFKRSDRSIGSHVSGNRGPWPVYAATGPCDHGNDGNAWIAFDRTGDFVLDEEHFFYLGSEPSPDEPGERRRDQCP